MDSKNRYFRYYTYIQPVLKHPAVKSFAPHIFSLFTVAFFVVFVIHPTVSTILELNKKIEDSKQILAALNTKSQNLDAGKRNLEAIDPRVRAKIEALIPSNPAITTVIKGLQDPQQSTETAAIIQIQPLTLVDAAAPPTGKLNEVSFNYSTQEAYSDLLSFLKAINQVPRLTSIDSLSIGKQPGETATSLSISGRAYYLK